MCYIALIKLRYSRREGDQEEAQAFYKKSAVLSDGLSTLNLENMRGRILYLKDWKHTLEKLGNLKVK